jgi:chorismate synthase
MIIENQDQKSADYGDIKDKFRPSHADYTYYMKYGIRDYRGGGRSSARETAMRVAAGAIARKIVALEGIEIVGYLTQIGEKKINRSHINFAEINNNDFFCPDKSVIGNWESYLSEIRKDGNSVGAKIELVATGIPVGLGEPIYNKLDSAIASALMSINAVKAVEIGFGVRAAELTGLENADEMWMENGKLKFSANHAGGILGGISSGQDIFASFTVKPTSSILSPKKTIDIYGNNCEIITKGRHDPCVGIRAVPVGEAMLACVLLDHLLISRAYLR